MLISVARALILYAVIACIMRLMGKRQIGQLQPTELIIMLMVGELVAIPLEDNDIPLLNSMVAVAVLASVEVAASIVKMKSKRFRELMDGHSVIVIREGKILQKELKDLRLTVDDLLLALRQKDVFDISTVQYAIMETGGQLSVLLKPEERPASVSDVGADISEDSLQSLIIADGRLNKSELKEIQMKLSELEVMLKAQKKHLDDVFLLTVDSHRNFNLVEKDGTI
ncbi:MAG: DUF421 domain-containing protein [Oscillospiraceae bacterium]|nr:DUF421 domain-containing protein [Oscillospiraceae bacterium]